MNNQIVSKFTMKHLSAIRRICAPLTEGLGVEIFTYYSIDDDGSLITLSNAPDLLDFHYSQNLYVDNSYLVHPALMRSGSVLTSTTQDPAYLSTIARSSQQFAPIDPLLIVEKQGKSMQGFFFSKSRSVTGESASFYLNNLDLLKKFTKYFFSEATSLIGKMKSEKFNLHTLKGDAFFTRENHLPLSSKNANTQHYLKMISSLSRREQECLDLYRQGHSAQATAARLNLSQRTVESYFENIKIKLNCNSKSELLQK